MLYSWEHIGGYRSPRSSCAKEDRGDIPCPQGAFHRSCRRDCGPRWDREPGRRVRGPVVPVAASASDMPFAVEDFSYPDAARVLTERPTGRSRSSTHPPTTTRRSAKPATPAGVPFWSSSASWAEPGRQHISCMTSPAHAAHTLSKKALKKTMSPIQPRTLWMATTLAVAGAAALVPAGVAWLLWEPRRRRYLHAYRPDHCRGRSASAPGRGRAAAWVPLPRRPARTRSPHAWTI